MINVSRDIAQIWCAPPAISALRIAALAQIVPLTPTFVARVFIVLSAHANLKVIGEAIAHRMLNACQELAR